MSNRTGIIVVLIMFFLIGGFASLIGWYAFRDTKGITFDAELPMELKGMEMTMNSPSSSAPSSSSQPQPEKPLLQPQSNDISSADPSLPEEKIKPESENYSSEKLKVGFNYPKGFQVTESGKEIFVKENEKEIIFKMYEMKETDFEKWFSNNYKGNNNDDCEFTGTSLKIGSYENKQVKLKSSGTKCENAGYFAANGEKSKVVRAIVSNETDEEIKKILESFKFL